MRRALWMFVLVAACNEPFSNEDLLYLKALPTAEQIALDAPGLEAQVEPESPADFAAQTRAAIEHPNAITRGVLSFVREVQSYPPSARDEENDTRVWGPFPGENGAEMIMTIHRVATATTVQTTSFSRPAAVPEYFEYALTWRRERTDPWSVYFAGAYFPSDLLELGMGRIFVSVDGDPKRGVVLINYDNRFDEQKVEVVFDADVEPEMLFARPEAYFRYRALDDGRKELLFAQLLTLEDLLPDNALELFVITTRWLPDERGIASISVSGGDLPEGITGWLAECWDATLTRTFLTGNIPEPVTEGDPLGCAPELREEQWPAP